MMGPDPVILMYHAVVSPETVRPADREPGAGLYDVDKDGFTRQMDWLADHGVKTVALGKTGGRGPGAEVVITFDDGEMNNYELAWPLLKTRGYGAYFFVSTSRIGQKGYLGWDQLRSLRDAGMIIGSHGAKHGNLVIMKDRDLEADLAESKAVLERGLKVSVPDLSVPHGYYDERVLRTARQVGFQHICVSRKNHAGDACWGRVAVKNHWPLSRFAAAVRGTVPWPEGLSSWCLDRAKRVLGPQHYDALRAKFLRGAS